MVNSGAVNFIIYICKMIKFQQISLPNKNPSDLFQFLNHLSISISITQSLFPTKFSRFQALPTNHVKRFNEFLNQTKYLIKAFKN
jgi:hypothetical protein